MQKAKIIGCGISGIVSSILLKQKGFDVEIFDTRSHIGGNCYDEKMDGITVHKYGLHIFHTNDNDVWQLLNRYTSFNNYSHKVRANTSLGIAPIPYNLNTQNKVGSLSDQQIVDIFFKNYSERHWGLAWSDLPKSITNRVPKRRNNEDNRYFTDKYQGIPNLGYTNMMNNMLDGIKVQLNVNKAYYKKLIDQKQGDIIVYTGCIDDYFDNVYGSLGYRSLRFEHKKLPANRNLYNINDGCVINECKGDTQYNRTWDNGIFLNENYEHSIYSRDFPEEYDGINIPMYPKNFAHNQIIYNKYRQLALKETKTIFIGRLATYKYLDIWMACKQAISIINKTI